MCKRKLGGGQRLLTRAEAPSLTENDRAQLGRRRFTLDDQIWFARLSGDRNPMHLDALRARRTQAGAPVVHGVHAALWALERLCTQTGETRVPKRLSVRFDRFIYLDEEIELRMVASAPARTDLSVTVGTMRAVHLTISFDPAPDRPNSAAGGPLQTVDEAIELGADDMPEAGGSFRLTARDSDATDAFPALARLIGPRAIAALAGLSTLVGMHCPGLHSIFSRFTVAFRQDEGGEDVLNYRVARFQPMLRFASIDARAPGIAASVEAFLRQPPIRQPAITDLRGKIGPEEAKGATVLIVGGSRGLGELTAKLAGLAGANVTISYATGAEDAHAVAVEMHAAGLPCSVMALDVRRLLARQLGNRAFSHIYYFATSAIFRKHSEHYAHEALIDFLDVYARAFADLCSWADGQGRPVRIFYPSSVAVEDVPSGAAEYAMAKAAGELLCRDLTRTLRHVEVMVERLPRLATDQTSTVLPVECADSIEVMLPILRAMHRVE